MDQNFDRREVSVPRGMKPSRTKNKKKEKEEEIIELEREERQGRADEGAKIRGKRLSLFTCAISGVEQLVNSSGS